MCFYCAWDFFKWALERSLLVFIKFILNKGLLQGSWACGLRAQNSQFTLPCEEGRQVCGCHEGRKKGPM